MHKMGCYVRNEIIFGKIVAGNKIITYICKNNDRYYAYDFYFIWI